MEPPTDPELERYRLAMKAVARKAAKAREHPADFMSFVMREETTRVPIHCLPFQRVAFDFWLAHPRSVTRMPVGFSKTYMAAAFSMWLLGRDPTTRSVVLSDTATQAEKPVGMVRDYIEQSHELSLVFPELRPSTREGDSWQKGRLVVERPWGIRDPSLSAAGVETKLPGSRLSWILVDDILSDRNTATLEMREAVRRYVFSSVLDRLDADMARIAVTNVPWAVDDLTFALQKLGWPTLEMDAFGNIRIWNTDWDTDAIRPSRVDPEGLDHRLTAHDVPELAVHSGPYEVERAEVEKAWEDIHDQVPLWPGRYPKHILDDKRVTLGSLEFGRKYEMKPRSEEDAWLKVEWVERAKAEARSRGYFGYFGEWHATQAFTGVDLATSRKKKSANNCIFTYTVLPGGWRLPLCVELGKWTGIETIRRIGDHVSRFNSLVRVETNHAQDYLRQWALHLDVGLPVRAHNTGKNKHDKRHGVQSLFLEFENGAWLLPCDPTGKLPSELEQWLGDMYGYDPNGHTGDVLMASWVAREEAWFSGVLTQELEHGLTDGIAAGLAAR